MTCTTTFEKKYLPLTFRKLLLFSLLLFSASFARAQCVPQYGSNCASNDVIDDFTLTGYNGSNISDLNTGCSTAGYDDRTTTVPAIDLQQGGTYSGTLASVFGSGQNVRIWIDFDNNLVFDPAEQVGFFGPFGGPSATPFSITLPFTAPVASNLRMRVRLVFSTAASSIDPCNNYNFGETHDYLVNVLPTPACSGTPNAGTTTPSGTVNTCNNGVITLVNTGSTFATGLTYEWEQFTGAGPWVTAVGGTGLNTTTYTTPAITGTIQYRFKITCANGGLSGYTPAVTINTAPPNYAPIPHVEDFESWISYCSPNDVPSQYWSNTPSTGNKSWRREDQGLPAWTSTWGNYSPDSKSGNHSARWHSSALNPNDTGNLDLYLDCSSIANPNKQLYFWYINQFSTGDSLKVMLSTNGGATFTQIGGADTSSEWKLLTFPLVSSSAQTIVRFRGRQYTWNWDDLGIDSLYVAPPCTGTPAAGVISPASPLTVCPGANTTLTTTGTTMAGSLSFQWQSSTNGGTTWTNVVGGSGATTTSYTTPVLSDTIQYRLIVTCLTGNLSDTSDPMIVNVPQPTYATLPYSESFESWLTRCEPDDIPSDNWTNTPAAGDQSWRREDQGASAGWGSSGGGYNPAAVQGSHSARFHSWSSWNGSGIMDLYVNCSAPGNKELQFFHIDKDDPWSSDSLKVFLSTNAGVTFTQIADYDTSTLSGWTHRTVPFTSTSATTVIRFKGIGDGGNDMGIDAVNVLLPCTGNPDAGSVVQLTPCSGQNFFLQLTGNTLAAGLTYQWQESTNNTTWTNVAGGTLQISTTSITAPTYFRCIVTCTASGLTDTTASSLFNLATFYYCYCASAADNSSDDDIGNLTITKVSDGSTILNNGNASPLTNNPTATNVYTNYTNLTPDTLFLDTNYNFSVTQIVSSTWVPQDGAAVFIDMNHDGQFDPVGEQVMYNFTDATTQIADGDFTIPDTALTGLTGMRVVLVQGTWQFPAPCGSYWTGETEDYLVYLSYPPCEGTPDGGTAYISDTLVCAGYVITLTDSTHSNKRAGLSWVWESATSLSGPWTLITGSENKDTINRPADADMYYRMRIVCSYTGLESTSNAVFVKMKVPYKCYCTSYADGGAADVTDNGAFSIGGFVTNTGGSHLNNPTAIKRFTDWTDGAVAFMNVDTTYEVSAYQIMKSGSHTDAKVTLFIDFDNNNVYDIPQERVWTGYTTATQPYINSTVTIPAGAVTNVYTGMRLIINEDVNPNVPSDEACGTYTSGETEDYVVKFFAKGAPTTGVGTTSLFSDAALYPNPTDGRFKVVMTTPSNMKDLDITITNLTGQKVMGYHYDHPGRHFTADLDMSSQPRGVYLVELRSGNERAIRKLVVR